MTYATELAKIEQEKSAELYTFVVMDAYVYYYTSYDTDISYGGNVYLARPVKRGGFSIEYALKTVTVSISSPILPAFTEYVSGSPYKPTRVEIRRIFLSDMTASSVIFSGTIVDISLKGFSATANCASDSGLNLSIPRVLFQSNCNNTLFDRRCGLSQPVYTVSASVSNISGAQITIPALNGTTLSYVGGSLYFDGEGRLIVGQTGSVVSLLIGVYGLEVGSTVQIIPGCDGSPGTCSSIYNNIINFVGFPYMPNKNPVAWGFR